jgi:KaiC/GvpD/RAD55 family RecA-like ATPase
MERLKTGVIGLDNLIEGGFPHGRTILITGGCGTGKTIFSMQFIYYGAAIYKEPGIYVTLDERPDLIRQDVLRFGWDLKTLEQKNMITIIDGSVARIGMPSQEEFTMPITGFDTDKLLLEILRLTKKTGAKRVVIDSIPALGFNFEKESETRKAVLKLSYMLTRAGVTSILTTEVQEGELKYGKYGVEEYVADGVIVLRYSSLSSGGTNRTIHIRKMRATKHSEDLHPLSITPKGVKIHKIDEE